MKTIRIPTAAIPHEFWAPAKAPDFFWKVRLAGGAGQGIRTYRNQFMPTAI